MENELFSLLEEKRMSKIRSAWEIALEKTENIEVDRDRLRREENIRKARSLAGSFLNGDEQMTASDLEKQYAEIEDQSAAREGIKLSLMQNITLSTEEDVTNRYEKLLALASLIRKGNAGVMDLMNQIISFLRQYPQHRKQLVEQLKQHFAPMLEQKAAQLKEKYGQDVPLSAENDPEFLKIAQQNLDQLAKQYEDTLKDAKEKLEAVL